MIHENKKYQLVYSTRWERHKKTEPVFDNKAIVNQLAQIKFQEVNNIPLDTDSEPWMKKYKELINKPTNAT